MDGALSHQSGCVRPCLPLLRSGQVNLLSLMVGIGLLPISCWGGSPSPPGIIPMSKRGPARILTFPRVPVPKPTVTHKRVNKLNHRQVKHKSKPEVEDHD